MRERVIISAIFFKGVFKPTELLSIMLMHVAWIETKYDHVPDEMEVETRYECIIIYDLRSSSLGIPVLLS
jgi:hypothetical protein